MKNLDKKMEVIAIWKRGERKIETNRKGKLGPEKISCRFGERFKLKANISHNGDKFQDKDGSIGLYSVENLDKPLGVSEFNLTDYANNNMKL
jgi:hypothetical protein